MQEHFSCNLRNLNEKSFAIKPDNWMLVSHSIFPFASAYLDIFEKRWMKDRSLGISKMHSYLHGNIVTADSIVVYLAHIS